MAWLHILFAIIFANINSKTNAFHVKKLYTYRQRSIVYSTEASETATSSKAGVLAPKIVEISTNWLSKEKFEDLVPREGLTRLEKTLLYMFNYLFSTTCL